MLVALLGHLLPHLFNRVLIVFIELICGWSEEWSLCDRDLSHCEVRL